MVLPQDLQLQAAVYWFAIDCINGEGCAEVVEATDAAKLAGYLVLLGVSAFCNQIHTKRLTLQVVGQKAEVDGIRV